MTKNFGAHEYYVPINALLNIIIY